MNKRKTIPSIYNCVLLFIIILIMINTCETSSIAKCSKNDTSLNIILDSTSGKLRGSCQFVNVNDGKKDLRKSGNVYSWLGVPYAEAPVGSLRFKKPVEVESWEEVRDATRWPNSCVPLERPEDDQRSNDEESFPGHQMWEPSLEHTSFSEDCLYLNIWVPAEAYLRIHITSASSTSQPLKSPIMVFFHGGSSTHGSSVLDIYDPSTFVAATNVIFITVNYRLAVNGFLYLDDQFPGNQGLLDQNAALKWIKKNAERFGGDPTKITIVGHSAGAALSSYHLFIKDSWSLYRNMILQSGSPLMNPLQPISRDEANARTRKLLSQIGCYNISSSNQDIARCAQKAPMSAIINASLQLFKYLTKNNKLSQLYTFTPFPPVLDGQIITDSPLNMMNEGTYKKCPILTGFTYHEGSLSLSYSNFFGTKASEIRTQHNLSFGGLKDYLRDYFMHYPNFSEHPNKIFFDSILFEYTKLFDDENIESNSPFLKSNYFQILSKIIGDELFTCPAYNFVNNLARLNNQVYLYIFSHRVSSTPYPKWYGAIHGDDLAFTFAHTISNRNGDTIIGTNPWANRRYSNGEKALTNDIINYWANFARFNDPNKPTMKHWPEYTLHNATDDSNETQSNRYIIFKSNATNINRGFSLEVCEFWNSYLPHLVKQNKKQLEYAVQNVKPQPVVCPTITTVKLRTQNVDMSPSLVKENNNIVNNSASSNKHISIFISIVFFYLNYYFNLN